jgi:hypothetical protein
LHAVAKQRVRAQKTADVCNLGAQPTLVAIGESLESLHGDSCLLRDLSILHVATARPSMIAVD